jgi:dienelactone hydrolase
MKSSFRLFVMAAASIILATSCNNNAKPAEETTAKDSAVQTGTKVHAETVNYAMGDTKLAGFVAYDETKTGARPVVLIVPEWWGVTDYVKNRAKQLAELGYLAMVVDMYGDGKIAADPTEAKNLATPFYGNPVMARGRIDSALAQVIKLSQADTSRVAAIGYCFGGAMVLNAARLGEPFKGVVSFHGNLVGVAPKKELLTADVLVCHGAIDQFVPETEVATFKKQMDSIKAPYTFKAYANATHAFTNPDATATGKKFSMPIAYNEEADKQSWSDMQDFFKKIFK